MQLKHQNFITYQKHTHSRTRRKYKNVAWRFGCIRFFTDQTNLRPGRLTPNILTGLTLSFLRDFHELPYHKSIAGRGEMKNIKKMWVNIKRFGGSKSAGTK